MRAPRLVHVRFTRGWPAVFEPGARVLRAVQGVLRHVNESIEDEAVYAVLEESRNPNKEEKR